MRIDHSSHTHLHAPAPKSQDPSTAYHEPLFLHGRIRLGYVGNVTVRVTQLTATHGLRYIVTHMFRMHRGVGDAATFDYGDVSHMRDIVTTMQTTFPKNSSNTGISTPATERDINTRIAMSTHLNQY